MFPGAGAGGYNINATTARLSASTAVYEKKLAQVVFKANPFLEHMYKKMKTINGGIEYAMIFEYGEMPGFSETGGSKLYSYAEELNVGISDNVKTATTPLKSFATPAYISKKELRENVDGHFDLWQQKLKNSAMSAKNRLAEMIWGTSGGASGSVIVPITTIITGAGLITAGRPASCFGLTKSSNTWMYSQEYAAVGEFADNGLKALVKLFNDCSINAPSAEEHPTLCMMPQTMFESYHDLMPPQYRTSSLATGDLGFRQLEFMGIPVRFERDSKFPNDPSNAYQFFMVNNDYLKIVVDQNENFKTGPWVDLHPNRPGIQTQIYWSGLQACLNFATQGVGYGVTINT